MNHIDLSELRDIHLPIEPNFWPLPIGWYILIISIFFCFIILSFLYRIHKNSPLAYSIRELEKIQKNSNQVKLLSQLLKRVAMAKYGRKEIAPLSEDLWQNFLLSAAPNILSKKQAHLLAYSVYSIDIKINDTTLIKKARQWIKIVLKSKT